MLRLRIFAGPNGSGKSSLYKQLENNFNLGVYINPDEIHFIISRSLMLDLSGFRFVTEQSEWKNFYLNHGLFSKAQILLNSHIENNILVLQERPKSYESAIISDFLRHQMLKTKETFSFETVFSHPSKLNFLQTANIADYKCYLYFAATSSPEICIERVRQRTLEGGHNVPIDKIKSRYYLSLQNLLPAMRLAYRVFIFDNSKTMKLIAEMTPHKNFTLKSNNIPIWVKEYILDKL